jgi:hypothetical protein
MELEQSYLALLGQDSDGHVLHTVSQRELHAIVPPEARMRLVTAQFNSPGFLGFFANKAGAEVIGDALEHRREMRVLKAGGTDAEVERRQAEADILRAQARVGAAQASEREADARTRVGAQDVEAETFALQSLLLSHLRVAIEQGQPPEEIAALMAVAHQGIEALDEIARHVGITRVEVTEPSDGPHTDRALPPSQRRMLEESRDVTRRSGDEES